MITHNDKCLAAEYASQLDYDCTKRDCGEEYTDNRAVQLSLGAFRAFEWLEQNGFEVRKSIGVIERGENVR